MKERILRVSIKRSLCLDEGDAVSSLWSLLRTIDRGERGIVVL